MLPIKVEVHVSRRHLEFAQAAKTQKLPRRPHDRLSVIVQMRQLFDCGKLVVGHFDGNAHITILKRNRSSGNFSREVSLPQIAVDALMQCVPEFKPGTWKSRPVLHLADSDPAVVEEAA